MKDREIYDKERSDFAPKKKNYKVASGHAEIARRYG